MWCVYVVDVLSFSTEVELQFVVERCRVAIHHLLIVGRVGTRTARISCCRHVVVASADAFKSVVESRIALLAFVASVKIVIVG